MTKATDQKLMRYGEKIGILDARLQASSPFAVMKRGYLIAMKENEKTIVSVNQVDIGDEIRLKLQDGHIKAKVLEKAVMARGEEEADI
jgi:exodeoxyribonuclease VII large subunit